MNKLTVTQAAQARGVSRPTILSWIKIGRGNPPVKLPAEKAYIGKIGVWLIDPADLEAYDPGRVGNPSFGKLPIDTRL